MKQDASFSFLPILRRRKGRGLLIWADTAEAFVGLAPVLREFDARFPRSNAFLCGPRPALEALRESDLPAIAAPLRFGSRAILHWTFRQSKARAAVIAWPSRGGGLVASVAAARQTPIVLWQRPNSPADPVAAANWACVPSLGLVWDAEAAARMRSLGTPEEGIVVLDRGPRLSPAVAKRIVDRIEPFIGGDTEAKGHRGWLSRVGQWLSEAQKSAPWKWLVGLKYRNLGGLERLRALLGDPQTIVCLGNGPSSVDPRLERIACDALFRVNHRWVGSGFLDRPDVVFTGSLATLTRTRGAVFAFRNREAEQRLLAYSLALPRRIEYVVAEDLGSLDFGFFDNYEPTNGAAMLATAVALRPKRLVVAGIDLFQHPAGAYPSDTTTPNAYTVAHDAELETQYVLSLLLGYPGELTIFSEVLEAKLREALQDAKDPDDRGQGTISRHGDHESPGPATPLQRPAIRGRM